MPRTIWYSTVWQPDMVSINKFLSICIMCLTHNCSYFSCANGSRFFYGQVCCKSLCTPPFNIRFEYGLMRLAIQRHVNKGIVTVTRPQRKIYPGKLLKTENSTQTTCYLQIHVIRTVNFVSISGNFSTSVATS